MRFFRQFTNRFKAYVYRGAVCHNGSGFTLQRSQFIVQRIILPIRHDFILSLIIYLGRLV